MDNYITIVNNVCGEVMCYCINEVSYIGYTNQVISVMTKILIIISLTSWFVINHFKSVVD